MRKFLLLFFIISVHILSAQVEFSQTYYYPISLDNNAFNYKLLAQDSLVYTLPYRGGINQLTNLGEKILLKQKQRFDNESLIIFLDSSVLRINNKTKKVQSFKDGVNKEIKIPPNVDLEKRIYRNDTVFFLSNRNDYIYYYFSDQFRVFKNVDPNYQYNFINYPESPYLYRNKQGMVEMAEFKSHSLHFNNKLNLPDFKNMLYYTKDTALYEDTKSKYFIHSKGKSRPILLQENQGGFHNYTLSRPASTYYTLQNIITNQSYQVPIEEYVQNIYVDEKYHTAYYATTNMMAKSFLYLNKIPNVFDGSTSKSCFTLAEDNDGNIYAGSYSKQLSIINQDTIMSIKDNPLKYLVGQLSYKDQMYFVGERSPFNGIYKFDGKNFSEIKGSGDDNLTGYYLFQSSEDKIYYGTHMKGLWEIDGTDLIKNNSNWRVIGADANVNVLTIAEDNYGKILYGSPNGIGVYNPSGDKHQFYSKKDKALSFGAMASIKDPYGTIWFGGMDGLYYLKSNKAWPQANDFKVLKHPFFGSSGIVTAFTLYDHYLIISNYNKMAVLDLKKFHENNEINIKYLTQQETNFNAIPEQNTLLTAKDKSVWFSTTDKIYNWDFKTWLEIPRYKLNPTIKLSNNQTEHVWQMGEDITLSPKENNFDILVNYATRDKLPRYISYALQYENDSIQWSKIDIQNKFHQSNLKAGKYTFHIKIFELNGETTHYKSNIVIPLFWYERWYFWVILGAIIITHITLFLYGNQKRKAKYHQIQLDRASLERERESIKNSLAQFQLNAINSQLRPHFLLNTFNTIGAHLESNSFEEDLLDTLGSSVDILFSMTRHNQSIHSLENEWNLVLNIIKIYKLVYIKELQTILPENDVINQNKNIMVPHGILHIPVENALIHGLNNKTSPPYILKITLNETHKDLNIIIFDNGIGLSKARTLSNIRSNGTGLKNLYKIVEIFNEYNQHKITFQFNQNVIEGTEVFIQIPKNYNYDISS